LFDIKSEWTTAEISDELAINIEAVKKSLKVLTANGYLAKQGTTRGAWYERAVAGTRGYFFSG
jgi:predicted ArsR family transcriptional regulator